MSRFTLVIHLLVSSYHITYSNAAVVLKQSLSRIKREPLIGVAMPATCEICFLELIHAPGDHPEHVRDKPLLVPLT